MVPSCYLSESLSCPAPLSHPNVVTSCLKPNKSKSMAPKNIENKSSFQTPGHLSEIWFSALKHLPLVGGDFFCPAYWKYQQTMFKFSFLESAAICLHSIVHFLIQTYKWSIATTGLLTWNQFNFPATSFVILSPGDELHSEQLEPHLH